MWKALVNHHLTAAGVQGVLLVLLALLIWTQGSEVPGVPPVELEASPEEAAVPIERIEALLSLEPFKEVAFLASSSNPFHTTYFVPAPPEKPQEPSKMREIQLTYQGFYERADGERLAFMKVDGGSVFGPVGTDVVGGLTVEEISERTLILQNPHGDSIVLEFRRPATVEIPR